MPVCTGGQKCIKSPSEVSPICAAAAAVRGTIRGSPQNVNGRTHLERSKKKRYVGRVHIVVGQYHEHNTCLQGLRFEGALSSKAPKRSVWFDHVPLPSSLVTLVHTVCLHIQIALSFLSRWVALWNCTIPGWQKVFVFGGEVGVLLHCYTVKIGPCFRQWWHARCPYHFLSACPRGPIGSSDTSATVDPTRESRIRFMERNTVKLHFRGPGPKIWPLDCALGDRRTCSSHAISWSPNFVGRGTSNSCHSYYQIR